MNILNVWEINNPVCLKNQANDLGTTKRSNEETFKVLESTLTQCNEYD